MTRTQKVFLLGIVLLAIFFRFYHISTMPGGLFPDEAANGLDINLMQQGQLQPFYERGNGREALFFYVEWASVTVFGKTPLAFHFTSAIVGLLATILCFLAARRLFSIGIDRKDGSYKTDKTYIKATNIALLAAFLMAVSTWHIVLSRTAFRAGLIPLFTTLTIYLLLVTYQTATTKKRLLFSFLTGTAFALGFYTYIAYRVMAPIVFMILAWPLLAALKQRIFRQTIKKYFWPAIIFILAFVIFFLPLGKYFYTHPGSFVGRSGQVSVFNPELNQGNLPGTVWEVVKQSILGYFTQGDLNWRHNISGQPFLSPLISPFFGAGLILATFLAAWYFFAPSKRSTYWKYFLLAGWFWGMLLPVVTTAEGIPHGLRSIGTIPVVYILAAWILYELAQKACALHSRLYSKWNDNKWSAKYAVSGWRFRLVEKALKLVVVLFVLALTLQSYFLYFVYAANSPENFYSFRSDLTPVSQYLITRCKKNSTYLVLDKFSVQTTDFMTSDPKGNFNNPCSVPYIQVDPEDSWKLTGLKPGDQIVFTQSSIFDIKKFKNFHPEARLVREVRNKFGQAVMGVYEVSNE